MHEQDLGAYMARLIADPVYCAQEIFREMGWDKYAPIGWVEEDMIRHAALGPKYAGILGWRSLGKTHLITTCVSCWDLLRDPDARILIVSKSGKQAAKCKKGIRDTIAKVSFLKFLSPRPPADGRIWRDNDQELDVGPSSPNQNPSVVSVGIDGQLPGCRASRVIGDDIETTGNTVTLEARQDLEHIVGEFKAISSYGECRVTIVGTYHHEQSVYIAMMKKGYAFRSYPVLFPDQDDKIEHLAPCYRERLDKKLAKPGEIAANYRVTPDWVADRKAEGRTFFAMQFMLVANLGDELRYPLKLSDLIVFSPLQNKAPFSIVWGRSNGQGHSTAIQDIPSYGLGQDALYRPIMFDPQLTPFQGTKMWIDPAGGGKDSTGIAATSFCNGTIYARAVTADPRGSTAEVMHRIAGLARLLQVNDIFIEDFGLQSMFAQILEPVIRTYFVKEGDANHPEFPNGWACSVQMRRPKNPGAMKEDRIIQALEPLFSAHRLVVPEEVIRNERLQRQITRITRQRNCLEHEDEIDALANCCQLWEDRLAVTQDASLEKRKEEAFLKALQSYGVATPSPRWFSL